ncbi:efflux RND transporter periplasmic adaptor subunit [Methyloceanibacter sp.]|uniref:efflux RND transporter periplasmic adaptor subunit n=1 Tax=Methyloceanibacter sp. TaxID=1965321 RepID=UPI002C3072E6|nr:efflux RND transporter periplasmic adaptor subunit [Methyloceanibacter sp.]HML90839.1 efflux RND transporter periplasmic adaptor subunit [Methyloceanibacter sp.]
MKRPIGLAFAAIGIVAVAASSQWLFHWLKPIGGLTAEADLSAHNTYRGIARVVPDNIQRSDVNVEAASWRSQISTMRAAEKPDGLRATIAGLLFSSTALAAENSAEEPSKWTCPMHPHYIADHAGTCPICGMDLVKLETGADKQGAPAGERRASIVIPPETLQTMGVRVAKAEVSSFGRVIRSYGLVAENERLQTEMSARTEAWIEDLIIRAVGDEVEKGDLLFTMYAPEFIVSQRDYLNALKGGSRARMNSVKTRLRAFGMQDQVIEELERTREVMEFVPFYADRDGTIAMIDLRPGSYVERGTMLTRIQDYSQVWLMVSVPEKDLTFIEPGTSARITFPNIPGREIFAKVEYVYPTVDSQTRTGQVRLVFDNVDGQLRPGAYADVAFDVEPQERLAVPSEAILQSGGARYVIASLGDGRFEPRVVTTGITSGRWTEISGEIAADDDIVVSGQFLIDSESALRESFRKLERLQLPLALLKLDDTQFAMIDHMVDAALYLHEALVDGYDAEADFLDPAIAVKSNLWPKFQHTKLAFVLEDAVRALEDGKVAETESELQAALAALVASLEPWMLEGAPGHYAEKKLAIYEDKKSGSKWLQLSGSPLNPYSDDDAQMLPWPAPKAGPADDDVARDTEPADAVPNPMIGHNH